MTMLSFRHSSSESSSSCVSFDTFEHHGEVGDYEIGPLPSDTTSAGFSNENEMDRDSDSDIENDFDAVEIRRRLAEDRECSSRREMAESVRAREGGSTYDRILDFFQIQNDDDSLQSTDLSQSPSAYVKRVSSAVNPSHGGVISHSRESNWTRSSDLQTVDARDAPSSPTPSRRTLISTSLKTTDNPASILYSPRYTKGNDAAREELDHDCQSCQLQNPPVESLEFGEPTESSWSNAEWPSIAAAERSQILSDEKSLTGATFNGSSVDHLSQNSEKRKVRFGSVANLEDVSCTNRTQQTKATNFDPSKFAIEEIYSAIEGSPSQAPLHALRGYTSEHCLATRPSTIALKTPEVSVLHVTPVQSVRKKVKTRALPEQEWSVVSEKNNHFPCTAETPTIQKTREPDMTDHSHRPGDNTAKHLMSGATGKVKEKESRQSDRPSCNLRMSDAHKIEELEDRSTESCTTTEAKNRPISFQPSPDESQHATPPGEFALHKLCAKVESRRDDRWIEALNLLSNYPNLANSVENCRTPLHVCCSGNSAPPAFFVRAFLLVAPDALQVVDNVGRLPLHVIAAGTADTDIMQLLVEAYPNAITEYNDEGMLPLHLLLTNRSIRLTVIHLRILLGQTINSAPEKWRGKVSRRRGEHLNLSYDEVNEIVYCDESHKSDRNRDFYDPKLQNSFKRLLRWKSRRTTKEFDAEPSISLSRKRSSLNPAALSASPTCQLALHMAASRVFTRCKVDADHFKRRFDLSGRAEIIRVVIGAHPPALIAEDLEGKTPLLVALHNQDSLPDLELVQLLLGKTATGFESPPSWSKDVQVHQALNSRFANPSMIMTKDTHQLPLHIVADQLTYDVAIMSAVHEAYPGAVHVQDILGRTPLHLALNNFQRHPLDSKALSLLLTDRVAKTKDDDGKIPFDVFVENQEKFPLLKSQLNANDFSCRNVFERFVQASLSSSVSQQFGYSDNLLRQLRRLPSHQRRHALSVRFVQETIHEGTLQASHVALILLNGVTLVTFLTLFRLKLDNFSRAQETLSLQVALYSLAFCIIIFELLYFCAVTRADLLVPQSTASLMLLIDVAGTSTALAALAFMKESEYEISVMVTLGTVATGLLWLSVLGYLARWWLGMAMFLGGALKVARVLFWPSIAGSIIIVGFAQMVVTLNLANDADGCKHHPFGRTMCGIEDVLTALCLLLWGTPFVNTSDAVDDLPSGTIALIGVLTVIAVLFVINMIIVIAQQASYKYRDDFVVIDFWEFRLGFLFLTSDLANWLKPFTNSISCNMEFKVMRAATLARVWDQCMSAFSSLPRKQPSRLYIDFPWLVGPYSLACRMGAVALIPVWIIVGAFSLGLLWPPQVRSWVFRIPKTAPVVGSSSGFATSHDVAVLHEDLMELKVLTYDKVNDIEHRILELRQLLLNAVTCNKNNFY